MKHALAVTCWLVLFPAALPAQGRATLVQALSEFIAVNGRLTVHEGDKAATLAKPLVLPSLIRSIEDADTQGLRGLLSLPAQTAPNEVALSDTHVPSLFGTYFQNPADFELGYAKLDADGKSRLQTALKVLYVDPDTRESPSPRFARFRDWQARRTELLKRIGQEQAASVKMSLNQDLSLLDQDYKLRGEKEQVEAAIEVVSRYSSEAPLFQDQIKRVREFAGRPHDLSTLNALLNRVGSPAAWVRVTGTAAGNNLPREVTITLKHPNQQQEKFSVPCLALSCQAVLVTVDHPLYASDVLTNKAWRRKDGTALSNGAIAPQDRAVVPQYIAKVLVVRDLQLQLDHTSPAFVRLAAAVAKAESLSLDGYPVPLAGPGAGYFLPGRIICPRPTVLAAHLGSLPKAPSPSGDLEWK